MEKMKILRKRWVDNSFIPNTNWFKSGFVIVEFIPPLEHPSPHVQFFCKRPSHSCQIQQKRCKEPQVFGPYPKGREHRYSLESIHLDCRGITCYQCEV